MCTSEWHSLNAHEYNRQALVWLQVGRKAWRAGLQEWLKVLGSAHSFRSLASWQPALRAAASHLQSNDNGIQQAALSVLQVYFFSTVHVHHITVCI